MKLNELKNTILTQINNTSFDLALETIRKALTINLYDSDLYFYMGLTYKFKNNYNCAYLCFENALQYANDKASENNILTEINALKESQNISINDYSIVVVTHNNLEYSTNCINSIRKNNKLNNYEIIVVDNNSTDNTPKWLKSQKYIKYLLNNEDKGFPASCNQGIKLANKFNDIFILKNDTIIMPNSIFNLRMALYSQDNVGSVGPISNIDAYNQPIQDSFHDISGYFNYSIKNNITNDNSYELTFKLSSFALLLKRNALNAVGLLDEQFTPGIFEDIDITLRLIKSGYKNYFCPDSFILNFGGVSFNNNSAKYNNTITINQERFQKKWGFSPYYSLFIRKELLTFIDKPTNSQINVLEVGCSCGGTLLKIKDMYPNANIYGIELNNAAAEVARSFAHVTAENVETSSLNYDEGFFDYIIFADVLEHLNDPLKTLQNVKKYLKKDGYLLASIPNVLNYTVLKDLINGNWTYQDSGILDKTHLRFFTLKEILIMFDTAKYTNLSVAAITNTPQGTEDKKFIEKICEISDNERILSELTSYQYLVKAQNDGVIN